jgi:hypothetical protein
MCAVIGGTAFAAQFLLSMLGILGDGDADFDGGDGDLDFGDGGDLGDSDTGDAGDAHEGSHLDAGHLFRMVSLRTLVAGLLFFGLGGIIATDNGASGPLALLIAALCGFGAFYAVYKVFQLLYSMHEDHTAKITDAEGCRGTVYVPIPPAGEGVGKVQLRMAGRIVELAAQTNIDHRIKTGATIQVVRIVSPTIVEVCPVDEHAADQPAGDASEPLNV